MTDREKLIALLCEAKSKSADDAWFSNATYAEQLAMEADHLIANGVTVQEWVPASKPPNRKDADKYGRVLAMEMGMMALVNYKGPINYPDRFPYWMPLPQPPKGE